MCKHAILFACIVITVFATAAWPQASTTTVRGTVRDSSNAVVPEAAVTLVEMGLAKLEKE